MSRSVGTEFNSVPFCTLEEEQLLRLLHQGLTDLGLDPQACPCAAYLEYIDLLAKWNRAYNLTGVREKKRMIHTHVLDSLAVLPYIRGNRCLDAGTGAGLPGFILALTRPEQEWTLLDSNGKKIRFLHQLLFELKTENVEIVHSRAEKFLSSVAYSSIISRAFGTLDVFYGAVEHLLHPGARVLAMKGKVADKELQGVAGLRKYISVHKLQVPGISAHRSLVILER